MRTRMWIAGLMLFFAVATAAAQDGGDEEYVGRTPPRLGYVNGQVSFLRPGAEDWVQAQANTALSPGDELYAGSLGTLELQIGPRAFVRGWGNTHIGLVNQEPDFIQFKVTTGSASFDIRSIEAGHTVEVDTPNGAFTIDHAGYYRVDVAGERTAFITRRGGEAVVTPAGGQALAIAPNEEVDLTGADAPEVSSFAASALDSWDLWNYDRTERLLDSVSSRYVPAGTYGIDDLDYYGRWRVVPEYGPVWVPTGTPSGWAPYSTGSWVHDPFYGWTWVDTAPWGWAPYHHGRWVHVNGYWGWAPGPAVVRPVYAPACVAFFGGPHGSVSIGIGGPVYGWVALGWGEPIVPWWGRPGHAHRPYWGGWGGPRVVNKVVVNRTTVVNVNQINVYRNAEVHNAVVAVHGDRFGRGPVHSARVRQVDAHEFNPLRGAPEVKANAAALVPSTRRGGRPPERSLSRSVVATRAPQAHTLSTASAERVNPAAVARGETRLVAAPDKSRAGGLSRPAFGQAGRERAPNRPAERSLPPGASGRTVDAKPGTTGRETTTEAARNPIDGHPGAQARTLNVNRPSGKVETGPTPATAPSQNVDTPSVQPSTGSYGSGKAAAQGIPQQADGATGSGKDQRGKDTRAATASAPGRAQPSLSGRPLPDTPRRSDAPAVSGSELQRGPSPTRQQDPRASSAPAAGRPQPQPAASQASQRRTETPQVRSLPGEPATRVAPNRVDNGGARTEQRREAPPPQPRSPQSVQGPARGPAGGPPAVQQNSPRPPQESGRGNPGAAVRPGGGQPGRPTDTGRPGQG